MAKVMIYFLSANTLQVFSRLSLYFCNYRTLHCLLEGIGRKIPARGGMPERGLIMALFLIQDYFLAFAALATPLATYLSALALAAS